MHEGLSLPSPAEAQRELSRGPRKRSGHAAGAEWLRPEAPPGAQHDARHAVPAIASRCRSFRLACEQSLRLIPRLPFRGPLQDSDSTERPSTFLPPPAVLVYPCLREASERSYATSPAASRCGVCFSPQVLERINNRVHAVLRARERHPDAVTHAGVEGLRHAVAAALLACAVLLHARAVADADLQVVGDLNTIVAHESTISAPCSLLSRSSTA